MTRLPRPLATLTATTFVTWTGSRITAVALPLVALAQTGDAWTTGLVGGMAGFPLLTSGWWGRRWRGRLASGPALAALLAAQVLGLALVPLAAATVGVSVVVLCASGLITGATGALLAPAQRALTADLADDEAARAPGRDRLAARALAWQDLAHRVSMVFAPPLGAWLLVRWGAVPLLWCESAATALAALAMLAVPAASGGASSATARAGVPRTTASSGAAATADAPDEHASMRRVIAAHPDVAVGIALAGVGGLFWFAFSLGLALLGVEVGRPGELIAAGMAGYGAASVTASAAAPGLVARLPRLRTIAVSWSVLGLSFAALPLAAPNLAGIAAAAAVGGACMPLGIASLNALISERTAGDERRAAFTAETVLHSGGASVGLLVGGAVIGAFGAGPTLVVAGVLQVLAPLAAFAWLARGEARRSSGRWRAAAGTRDLPPGRRGDGVAQTADVQ